MNGVKTLPNVVFLFALTVCVGCTGQLTPQAKKLLESSWASYKAGDDAATIEKLNGFLEANAKSPQADEAYYLRGLARHRRKELDGAKADLQTAFDRSKDKQLRAKAAVALGELAFEADDMALAENMYRRALSEAEADKEPADQAYYRLGCVLQRQGRWEQADAQFDRLDYLFPKSELAKLAGRKIRCTAWTHQAGSFSDKSRADAEAKRLKERNLPAESKSIAQDGRLVHVVQVGRFATYEQAAAAVGKTKQHQADAFITVTRQTR